MSEFNYQIGTLRMRMCPTCGLEYFNQAQEEGLMMEEFYSDQSGIYPDSGPYDGLICCSTSCFEQGKKRIDQGQIVCQWCGHLKPPLSDSEWGFCSETCLEESHRPPTEEEIYAACECEPPPDLEPSVGL